MVYVVSPEVEDDKVIAGHKKNQAEWVKIAKKYHKKILFGLVVASYALGLSFSLSLISFDVPWVSAEVNLQITTILFAILATFLIFTLMRIKEEIKEYYQLLEEYNLKFGELKLRKDIPAARKEDMRARIESALHKSLSYYRVPEARRVILRIAVWIIFVSLIIALVFSFIAIILESSPLAKACWIFLMPSIIVMFAQLPIVTHHY